MYWEINVALRGKHFFATAERSITDMDHCAEVWNKLVVAFPKKEGFELSVTKWIKRGRDMTEIFEDDRDFDPEVRHPIEG